MRDIVTDAYIRPLIISAHCQVPPTSMATMESEKPDRTQNVSDPSEFLHLPHHLGYSYSPATYSSVQGYNLEPTLNLHL